MTADIATVNAERLEAWRVRKARAEAAYADAVNVFNALENAHIANIQERRAAGIFAPVQPPEGYDAAQLDYRQKYRDLIAVTGNPPELVQE